MGRLTNPNKCNMKFTEAQLEAAIIQLLDEVGYPHVIGAAINRQPDEVLIKEDLRAFLAARYAADNITAGEIESVIRKLPRTHPPIYMRATKRL